MQFQWVQQGHWNTWTPGLPVDRSSTLGTGSFYFTWPKLLKENFWANFVCSFSKGEFCGVVKTTETYLKMKIISHLWFKANFSIFGHTRGNLLYPLWNGTVAFQDLDVFTLPVSQDSGLLTCFLCEPTVLVPAIWGEDFPAGTTVMLNPERKIRKSPSLRLLNTICIEELGLNWAITTKPNQFFCAKREQLQVSVSWKCPKR